MRHTALTLCFLATLSLLAGCEALGIETATQINAKKEAEGMAIGSACRYAVRGIEDCFEANPKAIKAAVFTGWKEMDQYMRDNAIVGMPSAGTDVAPDMPADPEHSAPSGKPAAGSHKS